MPVINVDLTQVAAIVEAIGEEEARRLTYVPEPGEEHGELMVPDDLIAAVEAAVGDQS